MFKKRTKRFKIGNWRCTFSISSPINMIINFIVFLLSMYLMITAINNKDYFVGFMSILIAALDFTLGEKTDD